MESLDRQEELLHRLTPTVEDLEDPVHSEFVEGAVWYFSETLRRARGGEWIYREPGTEPHDMFVGRPYVSPADASGTPATVPLVTLRRVVRGDRAALRTRYFEWAADRR